MAGIIDRKTMPERDDMELLREYVTNDSQAAFEELLHRHAGLVHSTALRMVRDPSLAAEVTQTTFIILAKKASRLGPPIVLSGWLYRTTQFAASRALRTEYRRKDREQEVAKMQTEQSNPAWEELSGFLDAAMARLGETDRNAVLLRYFENKSTREVGAALGVNEAAAQKRVARALEKLRALCSKRGVVAPVIVLTALLSANAVQAAPAGVIAGTAGAVKGASATGATSVLVKGTLELMRWAKIKLALTAGLSATALAGAVVMIEWPTWSQPHFEGRALSTWMARLDDGKRERDTELTWVCWQEVLAKRTAEQQKAAEAIRQLGEKALPYIRAALTSKDGKLDQLEEKFGLSDRPETRRYRAALALDALGPAAKPMLPELAEYLEGTNCAKQAALGLAAIGPEGWAVLTRGILSSNNIAAACSIWALGMYRVSGDGTVAALKYTMTNGESLYQDAQAAWALAEIGRDKGELVPMFVQGLKSPREDMRWACALALGKLGRDAEPAVPALVEALQDKRPKVREDAAQALQEIDPDAAARAGVGGPITNPHVPKTLFY